MAVIISISILAVVAINRIGNAKGKAEDAQAKSDTHALQVAYDEALLRQIPILTNDSVPVFAANARGQNLLASSPAPRSLSRIRLKGGTHITNSTAVFEVGDMVDDTPIGAGLFPAVSLSSPTAAGTYHAGETISITAHVVSAAPVLEVVFEDNGNQFSAASVSADSTYSASQAFSAGSHTIRVRARSDRGQGSATVTINVIASTPPIVSIASIPGSGAYRTGAPIEINATASPIDVPGEITRIEIYKGATLVQSRNNTTTLSFPWNESVPGDYTFTAKAYDDNNNSAVSEPIAFSMALPVAPVIAISSPTRTSYGIDEAVVFAATATPQDGGAITMMRLVKTSANGVVSATSANGVLNHAEVLGVGTHTFTIDAQDSNGTSKITDPITITVTGNHRPTVAFQNSPVAGNTYTWGVGQALQVGCTSSDSDGNQHTVRLYEGNTLLKSAAGTYGGSRTWTVPFTSGQHTLRLTAEDTLGAQSAEKTITFTIAANQAPNLQWSSGTDTPVPDGTYTTNTITLRFEGSEPDGTSVTNYITDNGVWRWGRQGAPASESIPITFAQGVHSVVVTSVDPQGNARSISRTITMLNNVPPVATISSPGNGATYAAGDVIAVTASGSDSDGTMARLQVLRDGTSIYDSSTTFTYSGSWTAVGVSNHVFKAIATDNNGRSTTNTSTITVTTPQVYITWTVSGGGLGVANAGKSLTFNNSSGYAYADLNQLPIGSSVNMALPAGSGEMYFGIADSPSAANSSNWAGWTVHLGLSGGTQGLIYRYDGGNSYIVGGVANGTNLRIRRVADQVYVRYYGNNQADGGVEAIGRYIFIRGNGNITCSIPGVRVTNP